MRIKKSTSKFLFKYVVDALQIDLENVVTYNRVFLKRYCIISFVSQM